MRFLVDQNIGERFAKGMKSFGEEVEYLGDHYPLNISDKDLLADIGEKGWVLISREKEIRYKPAEKAAFVKHSNGAFLLSGKKLSGCKIIQQLVRNWHRIKEKADNTRKPFIYCIPPNGTKIRKIAL
ncbi:MAG: hypothetical protein E3J72_18500 [Planctomycetota bacterium]|nr:MAG: hypothetical protein E3J72_18500 [Planctomycetota bacterium]